MREEVSSVPWGPGEFLGWQEAIEKAHAGFCWADARNHTAHCGRGGCEASGGRSVFGREVSRPREQKRWLRFPLCLFLLDFILTSVPL